MISRGYLKALNVDLTKMDHNTRSEYPYNLSFIKSLRNLRFHRNVTYFVGENGVGKSTLLEAIAIASGFNPEGGTRNFNFSTRASHSDLYTALNISRGLDSLKDGFFLRSESFFNLASEIEKLDSEAGGGGKIINSYGGKSLHEQSHGESFWALFMERFYGNGLYILDEPEAALSPTRQMAALVRMNELVRQNSQFIIATHSPLLLAYPDSIIYEFSEDGISQKEYRETELYSVTREFLLNPEKMIDILFNADSGSNGTEKPTL